MTTTMDELSVVSAARAFVRRCEPLAQPVAVETYAAAIGGTIKKDALNDGEEGWSIKTPKGKYKNLRQLQSEPIGGRDLLSATGSPTKFSVSPRIIANRAGVTASGHRGNFSVTSSPPASVALQAFQAEG